MNYEEVQRHVAKRIEQERDKRGMTLSDFAEMCGVPASTLNYTVKNGGMPTLFTAILIAEACGLTLDELIE